MRNMDYTRNRHAMFISEDTHQLIIMTIGGSYQIVVEKGKEMEPGVHLRRVNLLANYSLLYPEITFNCAKLTASGIITKVEGSLRNTVCNHAEELEALQRKLDGQSALYKTYTFDTTELRFNRTMSPFKPMKYHTPDMVTYIIYSLMSMTANLAKYHSFGIAAHGHIGPSHLFFGDTFNSNERIPVIIGIPNWHSPNLRQGLSPFMAPEIWNGRESDWSQSADVFALGMSFLYLLMPDFESYDWTNELPTSTSSVERLSPLLGSGRTLAWILSRMIHPDITKRMTSPQMQDLQENDMIHWSELIQDHLNFEKTILRPRGHTSPADKIDSPSVAKALMMALSGEIEDMAKRQPLLLQNAIGHHIENVRRRQTSPEEEKMVLVQAIENATTIEEYVHVVLVQRDWRFTRELLTFIQNQHIDHSCQTRFATKVSTTLDKVWLRSFSMDYLGSGACGTVLKATRRDDDANKYALKIVIPRNEDDQVDIERETNILKRLAHTNITTLIGVVEQMEMSKRDYLALCQIDNHPRVGGPLRDAISDNSRSIFFDTDRAHAWIFLQSLGGRDLESWLNDTFEARQHCQPYVVAKECSIIRGIIRGMKYLQSLNIMHRDLKPANVIFSFSDKASEEAYKLPVLIADYGFAKQCSEAFVDVDSGNCEGKDDDNTWDKGNYRFKAPEVQKGKIVTLQAEIYSIGLLILVIALPIRGKDLRKVAQVLTTNRAEILNTFWSSDDECIAEEHAWLSSLLSMMEPLCCNRMTCEEFAVLDVVWDHIKFGGWQRTLLSVLPSELIDGEKYS